MRNHILPDGNPSVDPRKTRAFTLIELLVVVAIVLILISIALPNFFEAMVRAKVGRARADIRTYITALDAYYADFKNFPRDHWAWWSLGNMGPEPRRAGFIMLTSPIPYLRKLPIDPFGRKDQGHPGESQEDFDDRLAHTSVHYYGASGSDTAWSEGCGDPLRGSPSSGDNDLPYTYPVKDRWCVHTFAVISISPAGVWSHSSSTSVLSPQWQAFPRNLHWGMSHQYRIFTYSPTNGTRSGGQILEMTGDWRNGWFLMDDRIYGHP